LRLYKNLLPAFSDSDDFVLELNKVNNPFQLFGRGAIFLQAVGDPVLFVTHGRYVGNSQSVG
jgi:hypothetical protein